MGKEKKKKSGFFADFKKFISKGNIFDLAIAVIIGGAFGKIISSLVNDIIMPLIMALLGNKSLADLEWVIKTAPDGTVESALRYGVFLQTILEFLIISFFIFLAIRIVMTISLKFRKKAEEEIAAAPAEPPKPTQEELLAEIRDLLKENKHTQI